MSDSKEMTVAEAQPPQQLITIEPAKYVELVFEPFAKRLADAKTLAEAAQFDVTTTAGMAVAVKHRATFRDIRVASEKARKERKAPILEIGKLLDSRQKEIEAEIEPFESRFDDAIKAEESRKEAEKAAKLAAEQARIDAIRAKIDEIRNLPARMVGKSAEQIGVAADHVSEYVVSLDEFGEFAGECQVERDHAVKRLREMQEAMRLHEFQQAALEAERETLARERAEVEERERQANAARVAQEAKDRAARIAQEAKERAERLEQERLDRAERVRIDGIRERIANIRATVAMQAGKSSASIESAISALQVMDTHGFDEFANEAADAFSVALAQLRDMHTSMVAHEAQQAELAQRQAAVAAAEAEQERVARERAAAEKLEADHAEALIENAAIDSLRKLAAEARQQEEQRQAAEAERVRRERSDFLRTGPGDQEIVALVAKTYDVPYQTARNWIAKIEFVDFAATEEKAA